MLIILQAKFKDLVPTLIDTHDVDASICVYMRLQSELCDEICYHFEVHTTKCEVNQVPDYLDVSEYLKGNIINEEGGKQASNNHCNLQAK